jgi:hypothetical protein
LNITVNPILFIIDRGFRAVSLYEAQLLSAIIIFVIALLISAYIIFRFRLLIYVNVILGLSAVFCIITWGVWSSEMNRRPAIIIVPEISALSGPADEYREIVKVHDGTEANIRDERNGYYLIQLPGGIGGWIKKEAVLKIFESP